MREVVLGIDIGGTNTKFGFVDREGELLCDYSISTAVHQTIESYLQSLSNNIQKALNELDEEVKFLGIGIGAPNGNYYRGTIEHAPNLNWKGVVNFLELFKGYYSLPMAITNDANAAAIGEMIFGDAKGMKDFIVITLGTGLGSGFVINGHVVYGHDGFAGELGHVTVKPNGRFCGCGQRGCLETYVSATGIKRTVFKMLADYNGKSKLAGVSFNDLTAEMITDAARDGDQIALAAFEYTGNILGMELADTIILTSPEAMGIPCKKFIGQAHIRLLKKPLTNSSATTEILWRPTMRGTCLISIPNSSFLPYWDCPPMNNKRPGSCSSRRE